MAPARRSLGRYLPWRSASLAHTLTLLAILVSVPLFLRMPPWCDLTLYDVAAKTILAGEVHYRDVFDTNLPGFVWLLTLIRATLGSSSEAVRAIDLVVVGVIVWQLVRMARRAGARRVHVAWLLTGAALFYPFTTEFNHAQRDVWMMLPALAAVLIRARRLRFASFARERRIVRYRNEFLLAVAEGACWGAGVWIKPHMIFIAAGVWLATAPFLSRPRRVWQPIVTDTLGNLVGGSLVGLIGITWLLETGTWSHFLDVLTNWLPHYTHYVQTEFDHRLHDQLWYFTPWSLMQPLALLLTFVDVVAAWFPKTVARIPAWLYRVAPSERGRVTRLLLAALFWSWVAQSLFIQRRFHYVHVPETLMLFAIFAAHRWAMVPLGVVVILVTSCWTIWNDETSTVPVVPVPGQAAFEKHPLANGSRLREWPNCWRSLDEDESRARQDRLAQLKGSFPSIGVVEIGEVADWLNAQGASAEQVLAWHDSPHAVYLALPGRPSFRFMHVDTPLLSQTTYAWMWDECRMQSVPRSRYVVTDLVRMYVTRQHGSPHDWHTAGANGLPTSVPTAAYRVFPYNQPVVFRSGGGLGRYVVHELVNPVSVSEYDAGVSIWKVEP